MSLVDVCYQQIKDNFWYGLFGDFKLIIDKETGYFNATKLCKDSGKLFKHWLENNRTKELIAYFSSGDEHNELFNVVKCADCEVITGTYVPKELILDITSWISIDFYHRCNNIILD